MKKQSIIISNNYRRPVSNIFKEKIEEALGQQNKSQLLASYYACCQPEEL